MPCEGISPCMITQIQQAVCQICGKNMGSGQTGLQPNYQKQVDPPAAPYKQIIPDWRYDQIAAYLNKDKKQKECNKVPAFQICLPCLMASNKVEKKNDEKKKETESPGILNSAAMKVNRLLLFLLASCLPIGGAGGQCPPPVKMMLCLPCPPPDGAAQSSAAPCPRSTKKPRDYTYRCESRELRGGNLYTCCQCNKRNGLQHDCPRTPCQGRPACLRKPWPDCWPSGGCHGIDYSRETGVKRYDPCREQRFDKRECNAPAQRTPKSECGGNMMVLVCPTPMR